MSYQRLVKKGLDLPITGEIQDQTIHWKATGEVALLGTDFKGMKPSLLVKEGEAVRPGQALFSCKKNEGLQFCSPFSGKVVGIHRGERRAFQSLVLQVDAGGSSPKLNLVHKASPEAYSRDEICRLLVQSGEWIGLRQRPFDRVAPVGGTPSSLFVTAMDTHPLAPNPQVVIEKYKEEFQVGLAVLQALPQNKLYLCVAEKMEVAMPSKAQICEFKGPHPAGCPGTHMHFLEPVSLDRYSWHIGYQDVIAIGHLFKTDSYKTGKVVGLVGPHMKNPQLMETYRGARISELVEGQLVSGPTRVISGSVLGGHKAQGPFDFLGHYHHQVSAIKEDRDREFLGWQSPGLEKFSNKPIYLSSLMPGKKFSLGSSTHGSKRAMVPIGMFEEVMPLDLLPTQLLRALASFDGEGAQELGCLELAEEDLALCTFVSPGKTDFGELLRQNLDRIEKDML